MFDFLYRKVVILFVLFIFLFGGISGYYLRGFFIKEEVVPKVTSEIILEKIQDNYFVVTKSLFVKEEVDIDIKSGSAWSDFLWGQEINARGIIRLDIGVDFKEIEVTDIVVNDIDKTISINLPDASVLDSSLFGDLQVESKDGILKRIFSDTSNSDYKRALGALIEVSEGVANESLLTEAKLDSYSFLEVIADSLGYSLIIQEEEVPENLI